MTGVSLEDANLVWQKVNIALDSLGAKSFHRDAFRALKAYLSQVKKNPNLQFVNVIATTIDDANGQVIMDGPCKIYGIYLKKQATSVDVYTAFLNDDTDDASPITDVRVVLGTIDSSEQCAAFYPDGLAMSVGVVGKAYTEFDGTTDSSSADTPNGFVILGAA